MRLEFVLPLLLALAILAPPCTPLELRTRATLPGVTPAALHAFLATPANWPAVVASSDSVRAVSSGAKTPDVTAPLGVGAAVDEIFGAPPLLPLRVRWTCAASDAKRGVLDLRSPDGLAGVATDCRMAFAIGRTEPGGRRDVMGFEDSATTVELAMSFEPTNALAVLAAPVLALDNALALKVLLPRAIARSLAPPVAPLDEFRSLMGNLYGVAGLAHAADLWLGSSQLFAAAGAPPLAELPPPARALAALWCAAGPLAFAAARRGGRAADAGLVAYGLVEVLGAALVAANVDAAALPPGSIAALPNALAVQGVVAASWVYSATRGASTEGAAEGGAGSADQ